jgi:hypothetical protein
MLLAGLFLQVLVQALARLSPQIGDAPIVIYPL